MEYVMYMNMQCDLLVVTGAPGSGKSSTVAACLEARSQFAFFDIDWLADAASELAGRSIYSDSSTWHQYGQLWNQVLRAVAKNEIQPIFFCPNTPADLQALEHAQWCRSLSWLLLDCSDEVRIERLDSRSDWTAERKAEAVADAGELRALVDRSLDTGSLSPSEVAAKVLGWAESMRRGS